MGNWLYNMKYSRAYILSLIASTPKGAERAKLLENETFRNLVLNSGANVTIYTGNVDNTTDNVTQSLKNIYVGLIQRKNKNRGFDGLGALGGMAERTDEKNFAEMSESERISLSKAKDDIVVVNGVAKLTKDIDIICNARNERRISRFGNIRQDNQYGKS